MPDVEFLDRLNRHDRRDVKVGEAMAALPKSDSRQARRVLTAPAPPGLAPGVGVATGVQRDGENAEFMARSIASRSGR